jgi:hypothetical protein
VNAEEKVERRKKKEEKDEQGVEKVGKRRNS